ncbi:MAG: hypothetical protein M1834_008469 [Cirrosporium novae-zelandiae]|nr:MAG: hypothetical protein M1834_008469 [Cirrosporium novae-zelandiae]
MPSPRDLFNSLLRPPVLHILRAAGFHAIRPAVLDTLVDLTARYLILLAENTASHALSAHNDSIPDISDVRAALQDVGAIRPQLSAMEEEMTGEEDLRGVEVFLTWMRGDANKEIRRIAGLIATKGEVGADEAELEDYLTGTNISLPPSSTQILHPTTKKQPQQPQLIPKTALKKKHSKTGEESRYQGTVLGKSAEDRIPKIEGGPAESIQEWEHKQRFHRGIHSAISTPQASGADGEGSSRLSSVGPATDLEDNLVVMRDL